MEARAARENTDLWLSGSLWTRICRRVGLSLSIDRRRSQTKNPRDLPGGWECSSTFIASPAGQHLHRQPAKALLADMHGGAALGAEDRAVFGQRREDHVLEGFPFAERVPGAVLGHLVADFLGRGLGRGDEIGAAGRAKKFDLHGANLRGWDKVCSDL